MPYERKPVVIESACFIGPQSVIQNGVRIGHNSVVAAGSFVNHDVEPFSIVGGTPARLIGKVVVTDNGDAQLTFPGDGTKAGG
jgi:acetyltransferase-like isoleucine patch superfamily enzyme